MDIGRESLKAFLEASTVSVMQSPDGYVITVEPTFDQDDPKVLYMHEDGRLTADIESTWLTEEDAQAFLDDL